MALTSRRKRPIDRQSKPAPHRDARLFIIATEGRKTEKQKRKKGTGTYYFLWSLLGSGAVLKRKAYGLAVGFLQHENLD